MAAPVDDVAALMRDVARAIVLPRFRAPSEADVHEKAPGEVVTVADGLAEARLAAGLRAIDGDARVIGEEAVAADPALLDGLARGRCWIVDPIDGTANYAAGRTPFAIMVALVEDGAAVAGWILDPVTDRLCHARRGEGAFVDGRAVRSRASGAEPPRAALGLRYLDPADAARFAANAAGRLAEVPIPRCAGAQYPALVLGEVDLALFRRMLPWDHAAGALFLAEAGGRIAHLDGAPWRAGDAAAPTLAAATPALWTRGQAALLGS